MKSSKYSDDMANPGRSLFYRYIAIFIKLVSAVFCIPALELTPTARTMRKWLSHELRSPLFQSPE